MASETLGSTTVSRTVCAWIACSLAALAASAADLPAPAAFTLAQPGRGAHAPVIVATNASARTWTAATNLAVYLGRIAGAEFTVQTGDGATGLALGRAVDFPSLAFPPPLYSRAVPDREAYVLRSHAGGVLVVGATDDAVEDAAWDLLYRLGYRQFFPGPTWEVVPSTPRLAITVDALERPAYLARRIWYGYGAWDYAVTPYREWCIRNRTAGGFSLNSGHAYEHLIRQNKAAFDAHPEYYGLVGGQRKSSKMCIGNPDVRRIIADHAVAQFAANPGLESFSVDPSDGGGWCECERCAALGGVSDRALTLANTVAEAVSRSRPGALVGMYAYNFHSPPPAIRVHSNVVISVACGFIKGGYTVEQLIGGWAGQGATLGIREYFSVNTWDRDLPGKARPTRLEYLARTIPQFHAMGARFYSAESSDNWGPNGLGYYLASRILWDTNEAGRVDAIVDDFLSRAFGPARGPMAKFYQAISGTNRVLIADDQLGRMFRHLGEARALADTPDVRARIDDLVLYARYVELYQDYAAARGPARQAAFEALIRHAYRMRTTMMVHTKALYRDLPSRDKSVTVPKEAAWNAPEASNPWKSNAPFTPGELAGFVSAGISNHPLANLTFTPAGFSEEWVSAGPLRLPAAPAAELAAGRGVQTFFTWITHAPTTIELRVAGGLIAHYRDRGNVKVEVRRLGGPSETGDADPVVATDASVPPDGEEHTVRLAIPEPGLHRITVSDGHDMTRVAWPDGTPVSMRSTLDEPLVTSGRWTLCFYVPKGTTVVGFFSDGEGDLVDASGRVALKVDDRPKSAAFHAVPVPPGQDGRVWWFRNVAGTRRLMTVPPALARSPAELLLPREVVEKDAAADRP